MTSVVLEKQVDRFQDIVAASERIGVSEFARTKGWRDRLLEAGCFEVVDRGGVVGYLLSPSYAIALSKRICDLEDEVESAQIAAMFRNRSDRNDVKTGSELANAALSYFDAAADELTAVVHGS